VPVSERGRERERERERESDASVIRERRSVVGDRDGSNGKEKIKPTEPT